MLSQLYVSQLEGLLLELSIHAECLVVALMTDALTGCGSRHAYDQRCSELTGIEMFIVIDVDRFKPINDTHGHAVGDQVLRAIAEAISKATRSGSDTIREHQPTYRTGGDEFCVVLDASLSEARAIARRIKAAVSRIEVEGIPCSVSVGVGPTEKEADAAMYKNKAQTRRS